MWAPTQRLTGVAVRVGFAVAVASFWGAETIVAYAGLAIVAAATLGDVVVLRRVRAPRVGVQLMGHPTLRRTFDLDISVDGARVTEVVPDVPVGLGGPLVAADGAWHAHGVRFTLKPRQRGLRSVDAVWVRQEGPLGLWARRTIIAVSCKVDVLPDALGPSEEALGDALLAAGSRASLGLVAAGGELRALRPFQSGDDPRHVDWKATARLSTPILREWLPDRRRSVLVVVDAGRLMRAEHDGETKFDAALRGVVRLSLAAEARGDRVGLLVYADKPLRRVPPLEGVGQATRLLRYVNDIEAAPTASDLRRVVPFILAEPRRSLVVVVTDVLDASGAQAMLAPVVEVAKRHVPIVVLLRDPHLTQALERDVVDEHDAYRRAAAERVMREREHTRFALRARGVRVLDVSMRSLALDVLQAYAEAREQLQ